MSKVDDIFIKDLKEILKEEWEVDNRSTWEDGSKPKTKRILQVVNKYDLSEGFPIMTLRKVNWKAAFDEISWIYFKQSNDVKDLNSKIWNQWKDENDLIHKAYGYQIAKPTMGYQSQLHYVINEIKNNPTSRRIMMNMFDSQDMIEKSALSLVECAYATHFSVKKGKLHMTLIQRSGDFLTAAGFGGFNISQYAFLQHAIAKECGLNVGTLTHFVQDLHLYDNHLEQVYDLIARWCELPEINNKVQIKIADKSIFDLTANDVELIGYESHGGIGKIQVSK